MAIKRYFASKDNTITNAYKANLTTRGVSGNMGQSDILEMFHIYAQASSSSMENCKILVEFDLDDITTDRTAGDLPASGNVNFVLSLYDAPHSQTTPKDFTAIATAISQSWEEGLGLDMENYSNAGSSNWLSSSGATRWVDDNGNFLTGSSYKTGSDASPTEYLFSQSFSTGFENLEIDVSHLVEDWIKGAAGGGLDHYGFGVHLTGSLDSATDSYYTKMFFARGSQFFFKRPVLEARWDSSKKDNRGNFNLSSSLVPASDNLMKLYLYNVVRGQLTNIPAVGEDDLLVSIYSGSSPYSAAPTGAKIGLALGGGTVASGDINTTASFVETGIYSCSFAYTSSAITTIYDIWHSGGIEYHTGSAITVNTHDSQNYNIDQKYVSKIINLKAVYSRDETARFRVYTRQKNWSPTIYTKATTAIQTSIVDDVYYQVKRVNDNLAVIPYGTGSSKQTLVSYDVSGSYFDLDINLLDSDTVYETSFVYVINGSYVEQPEKFRFRVE
jgi:hypothetical protein